MVALNAPSTPFPCPQRKPPSDVLYMMMHIVPGFTIFHKSHSESTGRLRDGKINNDGLLDPAGLKSSSGLSSLFNLVENEPSPSALPSQPGTAAGPQKGDVSSKTVSAAVAAEDDASKNEPLSPATSEEQDPSSQRCLDRHSNPYFSLCLALLSLAFGYLLVHGVISRQPAHLLPFFCLQVFDFVVALICMLGYMSSASSIGHWLRDKINSNPHFKDHPVTMHPTSIALIMISTSCLILAFKAYCIGMVWDCHRYLLLSNRLGPLRGNSARRLPFFWSAVFRRGYPPAEEVVGDLETNPRDTTSVFVGPMPTEPPAESALPKYEEALNTPANAYAPPPYFPNPSKEAEATPEKSQK
ncbi:Lysosomal-associated transmembrane protein 4A [Sparganum proliferum]